MADRAGDVGGEVVGYMTDGRKWDNHEVHEQEYQFAVNETGENWTLDEYTKFPAGNVINRRGAERDGEMANKTDSRRRPSDLTRVRPKDAPGDTLQNSKGSGSHQTESDECLSEIENAGQ